MTNQIGDSSFANLLERLRTQVLFLKARCSRAESEVLSLRQTLQEKEATIDSLQRSNQEWAERYKGLQAGTAMGASPEEIQQLRDRYLAMIREIDLCLSKLNG